MYKNTIIMSLLVVLSYIYVGCQSDSQPDERLNEEALTTVSFQHNLDTILLDNMDKSGIFY